MESVLPALLLAADFPVAPFLDASSHRGDQAILPAMAAENGYLFFKSLLPPALLEPVRNFIWDFAAAENWIVPRAGNPGAMCGRPGARLAGHGWDDPRWIELQRASIAQPEFQQLITSPLILDILATLYGEPATPAAANHVWLKLPGSPEHTTRPHRDSFYLPACPRLWTVWIPLTDTPMDVGPLGVVPGSHRSQSWPQSDAMAGIELPRNVPWATQEVVPGDVVFCGAETIHCAWSNISATAARLSLDVRYEPRTTPDSILQPTV